MEINFKLLGEPEELATFIKMFMNNDVAYTTLPIEQVANPFVAPVVEKPKEVKKPVAKKPAKKKEVEVADVKGFDIEESKAKIDALIEDTKNAKIAEPVTDLPSESEPIEYETINGERVPPYPTETDEVVIEEAKDSVSSTHVLNVLSFSSTKKKPNGETLAQIISALEEGIEDYPTLSEFKHPTDAQLRSTLITRTMPDMFRKLIKKYGIDKPMDMAGIRPIDLPEDKIKDLYEAIKVLIAYKECM